MFRYNFREYGNTKLNNAIDACAKAKRRPDRDEDPGLGGLRSRTPGRSSSRPASGPSTRRCSRRCGRTTASRLRSRTWTTFDKLKREHRRRSRQRPISGRPRSRRCDRYAEATRPYACDGCDHLCGAMVGAPVRIGATMRYLMYHDLYGEPEKARALFQALPAAARDLAGVDFASGRRRLPARGRRRRAHEASGGGPCGIAAKRYGGSPGAALGSGEFRLRPRGGIIRRFRAAAPASSRVRRDAARVVGGTARRRVGATRDALPVPGAHDRASPEECPS